MTASSVVGTALSLSVDSNCMTLHLALRTVVAQLGKSALLHSAVALILAVLTRTLSADLDFSLHGR